MLIERDPSLDIVVPSKQLTEAEALTTEFDLMSSPNNMQARVNLLWHYRGLFGRPDAERLGNRHVLWLIEHQPRAAVLATPVAEIAALPDRTALDEARALWQRAIKAHDEDPYVLGNAGVFLAGSDPAAGTALLERAKKLQPGNVAWPRALAEAYRVGPGDTAVDPQLTARLSLENYLQAAKLTASDLERAQLLARAATVARRTGQGSQPAIDSAMRAIDEAAKLEPGPDRAAIEHNARAAAGLAHLDEARTTSAIDELKLAARAIADQAVSLADLDLALAAAFYERSEKAAVIDYLQSMEKATRSAEVTRWLQLIRAGERPDFRRYIH